MHPHTRRARFALESCTLHAQGRHEPQTTESAQERTLTLTQSTPAAPTLHRDFLEEEAGCQASWCGGETCESPGV